MRTISAITFIVLLAIEPHGLNATIIHSVAILATGWVFYKLFNTKKP